MESGEFLFSSDRVETKIREFIFERGGDLRGFLRRGVNQEETIAFLIGKQLLEVRFRHQQFALEDAVGERGDYAESDWRAVAGVDRQFVSELQMENIIQRLAISRDRNHSVAQIRVEQRPGIVLLLEIGRASC